MAAVIINFINTIVGAVVVVVVVVCGGVVGVGTVGTDSTAATKVRVFAANAIGAQFLTYMAVEIHCIVVDA
jgi:ABC-type molybdate transport system substrate-binding protein